MGEDCDGVVDCPQHRHSHQGGCCYCHHFCQRLRSRQYREEYWNQMPAVTSELLLSSSPASLIDSTGDSMDHNDDSVDDVGGVARRGEEARQDVEPPPLAAMHIPHFGYMDNG